jgi:hypothetical protein
LSIFAPRFRGSEAEGIRHLQSVWQKQVGGIRGKTVFPHRYWSHPEGPPLIKKFVPLDCLYFSNLDGAPAPSKLFPDCTGWSCAGNSLPQANGSQRFTKLMKVFEWGILCLIFVFRHVVIQCSRFIGSWQFPICRADFDKDLCTTRSTPQDQQFLFTMGRTQDEVSGTLSSPIPKHKHQPSETSAPPSISFSILFEAVDCQSFRPGPLCPNMMAQGKLFGLSVMIV